VAFTLPFTALPAIEVFAVDHDGAQIAWRGLPAGVLAAVVGDKEMLLGEAGRPGVGEIRGLAAGSSHRVDLYVGRILTSRLTIDIPPRLPGRLLLKIATISDMHLGEETFGLTRTMRDRTEATDHYPLRCTLAAVREAKSWGAQLIVFKGDITQSGQPVHWDLFDRVLDELDVPIMAVPGNHDVVGIKGSIDHRRALELRGLDSHEVQIRDHGATRVIAVDSTIPRKGSGTFHGRFDALMSAVDTDQRVLMFTHHHFEYTPVRYFWPPGVRSTESAGVLEALAGVNPDILISSGHTHRNRSRTTAGLLVTEVGSVKDHPGVWAGYEVHQGGVRQTVRRVAEPSCVEWTDRTSTAVVGVWGRWSPGSIDQRSVSHLWTRAPRGEPSPASEPDVSAGHRAVAGGSQDNRTGQPKPRAG